MRKKILSLLVLIILIMSISSTAACSSDNGLKEILSKIDFSMKTVKTYKQIAKTYQYGELIGESSTYYKSPNKYIETSWIFENKKKVLAYNKVSDGKNIWTYTPLLKSVSKEEAETTPISNNALKTFVKDKSGLYTKIESAVQTDDYYVLEIYKWHDNPGIFPRQKQKAYYRKDIGYPDRIIYYDREENVETEMLIDYSEVNEAISDDVFVFNIPKDAIVVEGTDQTEPIQKIRVGVEGKRTEPLKTDIKEEIILQSDNLAEGFGYDIAKCEKKISEEDDKLKVEYYNKSGYPSHKRITFWYNKSGQFIKLDRLWGHNT